MIIETGSLVRASVALNVTQSTVTARLKALEVELGQMLIHRHKSGATLTPAGQRLERYAKTITNLWQQARQETALPDGLSGVCNLACETDLWPGLAEVFFNTLRRDQPHIAISVWLGSQTEVAGWIAGGKSDLAFTFRSAVGTREDQFELPGDRLILVSTDPSGPVRFDPRYVFVEAGDAFGRDHAAAYANADTARISFGNATLGLQHLQKSGGSAYLPLRLAAPHIADGLLHKLADAPMFSRRVFLTVNATARHAWPWFDACIAAVLVADAEIPQP